MMPTRPWPPCPSDSAPGSRITRGEISGLSRSVSNLGSSLGTALVGSVLVAVVRPAGEPFGVALTIMLVLALIGLVIAVLIPRQSTEAAQRTDPSTAAAR